MKVTVVGGGRMGLPLACVLGKHGASVIVGDVNPKLVAQLQSGECPYDEPGLSELVTLLHANGRLTATTETRTAVSQSDVVIVIVPAHLTEDRYIDYSVLKAASEEVGRGLKPGALVIYETTVSAGGTRRNLIPVLEEFSGLKAGKDFAVAYSPERVKANLVMQRLETTPKVVGGLDEAAAQRAGDFYGQYLGAPTDNVGTLEAAEMTKLLGMLYRDVNIALANELAAFCELAGVDFERVRNAANRDGEASVLLPGIGVGGHCTPVYPYFLTRELRRLGLTQRLSEAAREINDQQPARHLDRLEAQWRSLHGKRVHILGLGFRPGVKVDTFSPAYPLLALLTQRGALVTLEDPYYDDAEIRAAGFSPATAFTSDVIILNTAHTQYAKPDFEAWERSGVRVLLDGRNFWPQAAVESVGLMYFGVGRAPTSNESSRTDSLVAK